jgi:hypothetical protein
MNLKNSVYNKLNKYPLETSQTQVIVTKPNHYLIMVDTKNLSFLFNFGIFWLIVNVISFGMYYMILGTVPFTTHV